LTKIKIEKKIFNMQYRVQISRVQHSLKDFYVEADSQEEAEALALDEAETTTFSYGDHDFAVDEVEELDEEEAEEEEEEEE
jgi:hypothetical protein